ncbi:helix-turn-helix transcriptional regulator [Solihabitans fulvus]|uniref:helix-turn-helix transcriptional regulator n=1 Tax=Solihabitans fulvus TaxID=1892852 RepID=UPI001661F865|nr:AraC family transcriptional regulator [Solihabitans fulvus]
MPEPDGPMVPIVQRHTLGWTPGASAWTQLQHELDKVDTASVALASPHQTDHDADVGVVRIDDFAIAHGELPPVRVLKEELDETAALYLREGTSWIIHHGRVELAHRPGELVLGGSGTHRAFSEERGRTSALWVPLDRLTVPQRDLRPLLMRSVPVPAPLRRLLSTSATALAGSGEVEVIGTMHYLSGLADLLLRSLLGLNPDHAMTRDARRRQIAAYIDNRLSDPGLTVDEIAGAHHVSRTRLYQIMGGDGIAAYLRRARLDRVRTLLGDPRRAGDTIGRIGREVGFVNQAHFTRAFTREFGVSPGEFRAAAMERWRAGRDQRR